MGRAALKITKRVVDSLKPGGLTWDTEVRGFGVRCQRRGKVYVLKYRCHGRQRWYSIGQHGAPWTPETARREAQRLLGIVAAGDDPAEARDAAKADLTVSEMCDLYVAEGCTLKKPSTIANDRGRIERHIKPLIGKKFCRHVTKADVERMRDRIAAGKTAADIKTGMYGRAIVTGGQGTANKAFSLLGAIFTFAIDRGLRTDNPAHGVKAFPSKRYERFLTSAELARLGDVLSEAEREGVNSSAVNAIRLLIMTGCRKSEILSLRWQDVDFERSCFRLPDSKTGAKTVPVGAPVLKLIEGLPKAQDNEFVLPGANDGTHLVGLPKVWRQLRERAGLGDVRLHDLRHSFASVGAAGGDSLYMIGKLLGHRQSGTTARYAHLADDPLKAAADRISQVIDTAMKGNIEGAELVELSGRKA